MSEIFSELNKKLDGKYVSTRKSFDGGPTLSYVEGHHVIREANRIFGFNGWSKHVEHLNMVQCEQKGEKWFVGYVCQGSVHAAFPKDGSEYPESRQVWDAGFGQGVDKDLGRAHESAVKEAVTDMMKRCLKDFGDPFGLALYDKAKENVETHKDDEPVSVSDMKNKLIELCGDKPKASAAWKSLKGTDQQKANAVFMANSLKELGLED